MWLFIKSLCRMNLRSFAAKRCQMRSLGSNKRAPYDPIYELHWLNFQPKKLRCSLHTIKNIRQKHNACFQFNKNLLIFSKKFLFIIFKSRVKCVFLKTRLKSYIFHTDVQNKECFCSEPSHAENEQAHTFCTTCELDVFERKFSTHTIKR